MPVERFGSFNEEYVAAAAPHESFFVGQHLFL
jgi:hypothetical protein